MADDGAGAHDGRSPSAGSDLDPASSGFLQRALSAGLRPPGQARVTATRGCSVAALAGIIRQIGAGAPQLMQTLFDHGLPMVLTDPAQADEPIVFANPAFLALTGYAMDEVLGRNCRFLQGPMTEPAALSGLREALGRSLPADVELLNYRRDGSTFSNRLRISAIAGSDGRTAYRLATQTDVSGLREARRVEQSLRDSERRLRAVFDSATDHAMIVTDPVGRIVEWNSAATCLLGWSEVEALGRDVAMIYLPHERTAGRPLLETSYVERERRLHDERLYECRDGARVFAAMTLGRLGEGGQGHLRILEAREQPALADPLGAGPGIRLRLAADAAGLGTFDLWPATGRLTCDARCCELFGVPAGGPITYQGSFLARLHPQDRDGVEQAVRRAFDPEGDGVFDEEYRIVGLVDGGERWIGARGTTVIEGGSSRMMGTVFEITDRKRAEGALQALAISFDQQLQARAAWQGPVAGA